MNPPTCLFLLITMVTIYTPSVTCHRAERFIISGAYNCTFTPVNNATLVKHVYPYFDVHSSIRILEYVIELNGNGTENWKEKFSPEFYQPWRWYRTQGAGSSRLLLLNYYYYGLLRPFTDFDSVEVKVTLQVSPANCMTSLLAGDIDVLLSDYLLEDFSINENTVKHPFKYHDQVEVCSMYIKDVYGWGHLNYECCGYDENEHLECRDIYEDNWVWVLRAFLITLTILLFLHFPSLIPKGYRVHSYVLNPPPDVTFNLRLTTKPEQFEKIHNATVLKPREWQTMTEFHNATVLKPREWQTMTEFRKRVQNLQPEMTYTAHAQSVHFSISQDRLLANGSDPVSIGRSLFDSFIRCKLRYSDPLESCCRASICGEHASSCPPWHAWLRGVRTIVVMAALALPAIPLMYAISEENLDYQELAGEIEERGLARAYHFSPGHLLGRIVTGILASMYILNTVILVMDGATDSSIAKMYTSVLQASEKKATLVERIAKGRSVIKKAFRPIKKHGLIILPIWIIGMALLPVYGILLYLVHAPVIKIIIHAFEKLARRSKCLLDDKPDTREQTLKLCEMFWFFITMVFVFIVFTLGINFLIHVVALLIIKVLIDEELVYHVFPVLLLLVFYLRDSFKSVFTKYAEHERIILNSLKTRNETDLRKRALETWRKQENQMYAVLPTDDISNENEGVDSNATLEMNKQEKQVNTSVVVPVHDMPVKKTEKQHVDASIVPIESLDMTDNVNLFVVRYGRVRMRVYQVLLFLTSGETLQISKDFLFHTCSMDCPGAPGSLQENYIRAGLEFLTIGVFLLFVLLVVMAYGNAYYISPGNHIFITVVSGIVPKVFKDFFSKQGQDETIDTKSLRFEAQLNQKIRSFNETWELDDIILTKIDLQAVPDQAISSFKPEMNKPGSSLANTSAAIDLVLEVSSQPNQRKSSKEPPNQRKSETSENIESHYTSSGMCCSSSFDDVDSKGKSKSLSNRPYCETDRDVWSGGNASTPSNMGTWRGKQDKTIVPDERTLSHLPRHGTGWPHKVLHFDQSRSDEELLEMSTCQVPHAVESSGKGTHDASKAGSSKRSFKSSSEFMRSQPNYRDT